MVFILFRNIETFSWRLCIALKVRLPTTPHCRLYPTLPYTYLIFSVDRSTYVALHKINEQCGQRYIRQIIKTDRQKKENDEKWERERVEETEKEKDRKRSAPYA